MNEKRIDYIFSYEPKAEEESKRAEKWIELVKEISNGASIHVSYDGLYGEVIHSERKEFGPCNSSSVRISYALCFYNHCEHITYHVTGVKLEDAEFEGTSVSFCKEAVM